MGTLTYFVVLPLVRDQEGDLVAEAGLEAPSAPAALRRAQSLADRKAGALAFSRTGDPDLGEFEDAIILGRFGDTPADLASLMGSG